MRIVTAAAIVLFLAGSALAGGSLLKDGKTAPQVVINEKGEEVTSRTTPVMPPQIAVSEKVLKI